MPILIETSTVRPAGRRRSAYFISRMMKYARQFVHLSKIDFASSPSRIMVNFSARDSIVPADSRPTRLKILAAAARMFAEHGYDGVSLRTIASEAGVQLALINYHFGSKTDLYRAVWAQQYEQAAEARRTLFAGLDFSRDRVALLTEIVDIALRPVLAMPSPAGRLFARLVAREVSDPKESERRVLEDFIDPTARLVLDALRRAMPELDDAALGWGFQGMTGVLQAQLSDTGRTARLSGGAARSEDVTAALDHLTPFIVGGWLQLCAPSVADATNDGRARNSPPRRSREAQKAS